MIPDRTVKITGGDGAVGRSTLMLQLAVAMVGGAAWIGTNPAQGPVAVVSAEDDIDELHRRVVTIARGLGVKLADLTELPLIPLAGKDAVMAAPEGRTNVVRETPVWRGLVGVVEHFKPRLVIIDTRADVFAGNENDRSQARQFIGLLRGLRQEPRRRLDRAPLAGRPNIENRNERLDRLEQRRPLTPLS